MIKSVVIAAALVLAGPAFAQQQLASVSPEEFRVERSAPNCLAIDLGALGAASSYAPFMTSQCPDVVRNAALRKLWSAMASEPVEQSATF